MIGEKEDRPAFAYLCKDRTMKHELEKKLVDRAVDQDIPSGDLFERMQGHGIFILIASRKISKENLLPLNVNTEAAFRGHLMMTFISAK